MFNVLDTDTQVNAAVMVEREACAQIARLAVSAASALDADPVFKNGARHMAAMIVRAIKARP